jgi:hypothetical protein
MGRDLHVVRAARDRMIRDDSWKGRLTVQPSEIAEVLNRPISQELLARD